MGNSLLFKWEDSPALKHHCGFCERPLSHPVARTSCFGKHSEPCVRFHQAMFMRLRSHTCAYCITIDNAHHKRHQEIAEQLRTVYESCGEVEWTIVPSNPSTTVAGADRDTDNGYDLEIENDRTIMSGDTSSSKRERKDGKHLARAAYRSRAITQEEIQYIHSVIHSVDGMTGYEFDGPRNLEEVEEIEKQLRYHAQIYNSQGERERLKHLVVAPSDLSGVDFAAEMDRILDVFRITELLKRNTNTKGMHGKDLKSFLALVDAFKQNVVEDIVLVKKDIAEVRMRRAGYLRYTSRAAYSILEDRYFTTSRKNGENTAPRTSDSAEETKTATDEANRLLSRQQEDQSPGPIWTGDGPDRRHLETIHQRINGDDGLHEATIEPYQAPLLLRKPDPTPGRGPLSIRVTSTKPAEQAVDPMASKGSKRIIPPTFKGQKNAVDGTISVKLAPERRVWGSVRGQRSQLASPTGHADISKSLVSSSAVRNSSTQPCSRDLGVKSHLGFASKEPESLVAQPEEMAGGHPIVSQKKKSKKQREARRKAKKALDTKANCEDLIAEKGAEDQVSQVIDTPPGDAMSELEVVHQIEDTDENSVTWSSHEIITSDCDMSQTSESIGPVKEDPGKASTGPSHSTLPITTHGKQSGWINFVRNLVVDQLTNPFFPWSDGCSYASWCAFERNGVPDCPFHLPYCVCANPEADQCYIVMPCAESCTTGPYNRLRGEKLLSLYEDDHRTQGQLMIVDDDLIDYLVKNQPRPTCCHDLAVLPARLAKQYANVADGFQPGPLITQERQFDRLKRRNMLRKQPLTHRMLQEICSEVVGRKGKQPMCYCRIAKPDDSSLPQRKDIITCSYQHCLTRYFHISCVKRLGVDRVSHWYCTFCEDQMHIAASQTLRNLGFADFPVDMPPSHSSSQDIGDIRRLLTERFKQLSGTPRSELMKMMRKMQPRRTDHPECDAAP